MAESNLDRLIQQCRSNDVDMKVDAVTKMQAEFEAGVEITDAEALITALRACVRHQNQLLSTATLGALPPLFPLLAQRAHAPARSAAASPATSTSSSATPPPDAGMLRQLLAAFLAAPGVLERLGDNRERPRELARQALVVLGGLAFRAGVPAGAVLNKSRGPEPPLSIFERSVRETGLASKVARVREQSMLALVQIRRANHLFPIRPYLPALVDALEDSDASVRECAKTSVVELFTGPGVTDAARADLKKALAQKGTRRPIADAVLAQVAARGSAPTTPALGSDDSGAASGKKEYIPPSMMLMGKKPSSDAPAGPGTMGRTVSTTVPRAPSRSVSTTTQIAASMPPTPTETSGDDIKVVYIASDRDLENEFAQFGPFFEGKETENNWKGREGAINRVRGMLKGDVHDHFEHTFMSCLTHGFLALSFKALVSLRTSMASSTCSLYAELANALGTAIDPLGDALYSNLLNMAGLTKKIMAEKSQSTVTVLINRLSPLPRTIVPLLARMMQDRNVQLRLYGMSHVKTYIDVHGARSRTAWESSGHADTIEQLTKKSLSDQNPGVRETGRATFWSFNTIWPARATVMLAAMDTVTRKAVEKACPVDSTEAQSTLVAVTVAPTETGPKKSSVAAAIAASRAKARAIANAPPSLMHQATSASHANNTVLARAMSPPGTRRAPSPSLSSRSSDGTPIAVRAPVTVAKTRAPSGTVRGQNYYAMNSPPRAKTPTMASPPLSPTMSSHKRKVSASHIPLPNTPPRSTPMSRALTTPLPGSPPASTVVTPPMPKVAVPPRQASPRRSIASVIGAPLLPHTRQSTILPNMYGADDSLLLASTIPIPGDDDSDMDMDMDMDDSQPAISPFATPRPAPRLSPGSRTGSVSNSLSTASNSQAHSHSPHSETSFPFHRSQSGPPPSGGTAKLKRTPTGPVVEDALRARAEQAESAAERLLELVDPDEHPAPPASNAFHSQTGASPNGANGLKVKAKLSPGLSTQPRPPATPMNHRAAVARNVSQFQDSPAQRKNGTSAMMDVLTDHQDESGWWLKRMKLLEPGTDKQAQVAATQEDVDRILSSLVNGSADLDSLQWAVRSFTSGSAEEQNPLLASHHPEDSVWASSHNSERLLDGLIAYMTQQKDDDRLEYALIVLWELVDRYTSQLEGRESDIFAVLLRIRYCNQANILAATNTIRDALVHRTDPVFGLTTIHGSLRTFLSEPAPTEASTDAREASLAFGLMALAKFIVRLPAEILEDELPRLKATLIPPFLDAKSPVVVREASALVMIAAQNVLRDEAHLFALLDGLPDEKKNLLTYLFDKNGVRGPARGAAPDAADKLQREMRRLDGRTSTPMRSRPPH